MVSIISPEEDKRFNPISALEYLETRRFKVENFLNERIRKVDQPLVLRELLKDPVTLANIIKYNYEMSEEQRIRFVVEKIIKEGNLTIMVGAKGYGKTATSVWLMDYVHKNFDKKVYYFGYSEELEKQYPFVKQTVSLTDPEENSFLVFDEAQNFFFARSFSTREQKARILELPTVRHRGISLLLITQFSTSLDVDLFLLCDYIWFKPYFVGELDKRLNLPDWLKYTLPKNPNENLVYDMNLETIYVFKNPLPPIWNEKLSKPFSPIRDMKEAKRYINKLKDLGLTPKEIATLLRIRGIDLPEEAI